MDYKKISANLNVHINGPSVRNDLWSRLRSLVAYGVESSDQDCDCVQSISESLSQKTEAILAELKSLEFYMGYPGFERFSELIEMWERGDLTSFSGSVGKYVDEMETGNFRRSQIQKLIGCADEEFHHFDLLVVKSNQDSSHRELQEELAQWFSKKDGFVYSVIIVENFEDALLATLVNSDIQACVIFDHLEYSSRNTEHQSLQSLKDNLKTDDIKVSREELAVTLGSFIHQLRPEISLFLSAEKAPELLANGADEYFERVFYSRESLSELHLSVIKSVSRRYETPFFDAVKRYSREPVGTFHALPISRGNSVFNSHWIKDFSEFYGADIFLAESSATTGGMDSILQPTGALKLAQESAARSYGSKASFFVTNGTTMSNKVIHQALSGPKDIVLLDRGCHESHHLAFLVSGASAYYLESYSLDDYSISGAVPLETVKRALVSIAEEGLLDRVKMVILTNCTFDGLTYNVESYMEELLAIKPDLIFLWDEAWFGFARFVPHYRQRTAMYSASEISDKLRSPEYRAKYEEYKKSFLDENPEPNENWISQSLMADPDRVKVRVYSTQSTHKTLSCFRQGSVIHMWDEEFIPEVADQFKTAYLTHSTTSPNYQILASMDVSRRQMDMEGYELVQRQIEMALLIRNSINTDPVINKCFEALGPSELIPEMYRKSGVKSGFRGKADWEAVASAWAIDDFVLDPCKINVTTSKTGISGFELRTKYLAEKYNIQVNKTGLNSFCLMTNIGTTRSSVAYLINCLKQISQEISGPSNDGSAYSEKSSRTNKLQEIKLQPIPDVQDFHPKYLDQKGSKSGSVRQAYLDGYDLEVIEYLSLEEINERIQSGQQVVGATFIIPVPPGYPLILPGQLINEMAIAFLQELDPQEIIGLSPELGVRVFKNSFFIVE